MSDHLIPDELIALTLQRKSGEERFHEDGEYLGPNLLSYWRWSASDLLGNTERGRLAEYIVATALDLAEGVRSGWEAYDLETPSGIRIEVKASGYVQTWGQKALSKVIFGIRPTRAWDPIKNVFAEDVRHQADVYVFALFAERNKTEANPLNVSRWEFYVLPASILKERIPIQKTINLSSLLRLGAIKVGYRELRDTIERFSMARPGSECK